MSFAATILRRLSEQSRIQSTTGIFVGVVAGLARVNVQGSTVDLRMDGWAPAIPGTPVRVETVNGVMRVTGPAATLSPRGTITATGSVTATVDVDGVEYELPWVGSYSPVVTDVVAIDWQSQMILGEESAPPTVYTPAEIPPATRSFTNLLIYPTASGKYSDTTAAWWGGPEVWASPSDDGVWVYGGRFSALAGASNLRAEIYLPRISESGSCSIGLHAHPSIPGGAPTIGSLVTLSPRSGWVRLPDAWGAHLRDNPTHGVGVTSGSGLNKWRGVGQDMLSGVLRFSGVR